MKTDSFFDPHRGRVIRHAPEERVRQQLLEKMRDELGFPKAYLAVERSLSEFTADEGNIPKRRLDIVAFYKNQGVLLPLLIVECKAVPLHERMLDQIFGYNHFVRAPFIALVNQHKTIFGRYDTRRNTYTLSNGFLSYEHLLNALDLPA